MTKSRRNIIVIGAGAGLNLCSLMVVSALQRNNKISIVEQKKNKEKLNNLKLKSKEYKIINTYFDENLLYGKFYDKYSKSKKKKIPQPQHPFAKFFKQTNFKNTKNQW